MTDDTERQAARRRYWRRAIEVTALCLPVAPPLVLGRTLVAVLAGLPVAIATGLLTFPFWSEDHFWAWQWSEIRRRWMTALGSEPLRRPEQATRWLAEHPERNDEWAVTVLLIARRYEEARIQLSALPEPTTEWQAFFRKSTVCLLEFHSLQPVDLEGLSAAANAIHDPEVRHRAEAQVASLALSLSMRGDISRSDALSRVRKLTPRLRLTVRQQLRLWLVHFPGVAVVLFLFLLWIILLALGSASVTVA